jgi:hypothetical protein
MARRSWVVVPLAMLAVIGPAPTAYASSGTHRAGNVLAEGQTLRAGTSHDELESRNHRFTLTVGATIMTLTETVPIDFGRRVLLDQFWSREDRNGNIRDHDKTTLRLQRNGNLVLRTHAGRALWSTHTRGKHNLLRLSNGGNLVVTDRDGKRLWASHTTSVDVGSGGSLPSGTTLRRQPLEGEVPHIVEKFTMQRNGDLVFRCNSHVAWQSHTSVPGSALFMKPNGSLVVRTPSGRTAWSSHTAGHGPNVYFEMQAAALSRLSDGYRYWFLPLSRDVNCG